MTDEENFDKALSYAYRLFKYRPRSRKELQERLKLQRYNTAIIDRVIHEFEQQGLIDDKRFARLWALTRIQRKSSSLTNIKGELLLKGVDSQIIDDTLGRLKKDFNEYEIAKSLATKKLRLLTGVKKLNPAIARKGGIKAKKRLFDYLKRRGFCFDVIYKVLDEIYD
ncbi:MAG: regulatory protein RecX [Candidatus Omnitrophota bacterium]|nr:MAG: regulatory protein RecX [Candidatus Omnitrophota bacterium]